jgi:hypothetical protein
MDINTGDHDTFSIAYHAALLFRKLFEHQPQITKPWGSRINKFTILSVAAPVRQDAETQ